MKFESKHSFLIYNINVKSPNLDLKQGISYLERERGKGEERETEIEGRDRDRWEK